MFVRNGQVSGSVLHSAVPGAERPTKDAEPDADAVEEQVPQTESDAPTDGEPPAPYALKGDWVDHAVNVHGAERTEAEKLTKPDLIELYGG
jgi:hypothetical protein